MDFEASRIGRVTEMKSRVVNARPSENKSWYEAFVLLRPKTRTILAPNVTLRLDRHLNRVYTASDKLENKAAPHLPEHLKEIVCSDCSLDQKREEIEDYISFDEGFVAWALLAMRLIEDIEQHEGVQASGLGYDGWDGSEFRSMTATLLQSGYIPSRGIEYCQRERPKGQLRTYLGKHSDQLIAFICLLTDRPWLVPPRIARAMGIDIGAERREHKKLCEAKRRFFPNKPTVAEALSSSPEMGV